MSYAVMPITDWQNIVDAVRAKTGKEDTLVSSQVPAEINSITGGGSGGGASLNIAYGNTAPEDTSKLWVKTSEPSKVIVTHDKNTLGVGGDGEGFTTIPSVLADSFSYRVSAVSVGTDIYYFGYNNSNIMYMFSTTDFQSSAITPTAPSYQGYFGTCVVGTNIYIFGGGQSGSYKNHIVKIDVVTGTKTTLGVTMPFAMSKVACASVGTKIYLFGGIGNNNSYQQSVLCVDTENDTLSTLSASVGKAYGLHAITVGTDIYLLGGYYSSGVSNLIKVFDTINQTIKTLDVTLPYAVQGAGAVLHKSKIYLFGGTTTNYTMVNSIVAFDPLNKKVETLLDVLPAACDAKAISIGADIYVLCSGSKDVLIYNVGFSLENETLAILHSGNGHSFTIVNGEIMNVAIGVDKVYKGNEKNEGKAVEAAIFQDGEWTVI